MLHPDTTRALADAHIEELHRRAAHYLPTTPATARFLGLRSATESWTHLRRRARKAASSASAAASTAAAAVAPAQGAQPDGGSPRGCVA